MFEIDGLKPTILSWLTVGVMAVTFIVLAKYLVNAYPNPVTDLFKSTFEAV